MEKGLFNDLIEAAKEMVDIEKGKKQPKKVHVHSLPNVKLIREGLKLSQTEFSKKFGIELRTLQDWETKRRNPTGAAVTLLKVIAKNPKAVAEAIREVEEP